MYFYNKCFKTYSWYCHVNLKDEVTELQEGICEEECTISRLIFF